MHTIQTYAAQTAHYFSRPHTGIPSGPIHSPAAWRGSDLEHSADWRVSLSAGHRDELSAALEAAKETGKPTEELSVQDFPLPTLAPEIARWREEIDSGRGFLLISGVPVHEWSQAENEIIFWCLGLHMGRPGAQNPAGDLLGHVLDTEENIADPFVRLYRTRSEIAYHCDAADVVGLLCLQSARRGGESRIVSSVSLYNTLLTRRPDLIPRLYESFLLDLRNEDQSDLKRHVEIPLCRYAEGKLRSFYHSDYFRSVQRHPEVPPFDSATRDVLDLYDQLGEDPELRLEMDLAPGDIQWLSNHTILHARRGYEEGSHPAHKRHLLRLWLSIGAQDRSHGS